MINSVALESAMRALRANQLAMAVTGHNIANVHSPGYSRQRVKLQASEPLAHPSLLGGFLTGQIGTGVDAVVVDRVRDQFVERQLIQTNYDLQKHQMLAATLEQIESIFNEPSAESLSDAFAAFFVGLQELSVNPEAAATRSVVIEEGNRIAGIFRMSAARLIQLRRDLNAELDKRIIQLNSQLHQIGNLNGDVSVVSARGDTPNDLLDRRDALIRSVSDLIDVTVVEDKFGAASVFVGGELLVQGNFSRQLQAIPVAENHNLSNVVFADTGQSVPISSGKFRALLDARDSIVPRRQSLLDDMASTLISSVNRQHNAGLGLDGSTSLDFFTGSGAADIQVNAAIIAAPVKIAASASGAEGDGANAIALADLQRAQLLSSGQSTFEGFYQSLIAELGVESYSEQQMEETFSKTLQTLQDQRDSVSAVNLDEEMVNIIRFQQGFAAAAKMIQELDRMTEEILGLVGG